MNLTSLIPPLGLMWCEVLFRPLWLSVISDRVLHFVLLISHFRWCHMFTNDNSHFLLNNPFYTGAVTRSTETIKSVTSMITLELYQLYWKAKWIITGRVTENFFTLLPWQDLTIADMFTVIKVQVLLKNGNLVHLEGQNRIKKIDFQIFSCIKACSHQNVKWGNFAVKSIYLGRITLGGQSKSVLVFLYQVPLWWTFCANWSR